MQAHQHTYSSPTVRKSSGMLQSLYYYCHGFDVTSPSYKTNVIGGKLREGKADWKNKLLSMKLPPPIKSFSDLWYGHFIHYFYMA